MLIPHTLYILWNAGKFQFPASKAPTMLAEEACRLCWTSEKKCLRRS